MGSEFAPASPDPATHQRTTRIVCTLGPATDDPETLRRLHERGMDVARLNTSHGSPETRRERCERLREAVAASDRAEPPAVLLDLAGPEIRTAAPDAPVTLDDGTTVTFLAGEVVTSEVVGLSYPLEGVAPGDEVSLDDGRIATTVTSVATDEATLEDVRTDLADVPEGELGDLRGPVLEARVDAGGTLSGRAGVNVPSLDLDGPILTDADRRDLDAVARGEVPADYVAISFVGDAGDVRTVQEALAERDCSLPVIAKIERARAVDALPEILEVADGVMIARGDLGVECRLDTVPIIQKRIVAACRRRGVPVITATELLESMTSAPRPTRAEATDVANAILDGTDAVMLSGETAVGDHPVRVVETLAQLIATTEQATEAAATRTERPTPGETYTRAPAQTGAVASAAASLASTVDARAVVIATESGRTAREMAAYRPAVPVVATTPDERVARQLMLLAGVTPRHVARLPPDDAAGERGRPTGAAVIQQAIQEATRTSLVSVGDPVVVVSGLMTGLHDEDVMNTLQVRIAADTLCTGRPLTGGFATGPLYALAPGEGGDAGDVGDRLAAEDDGATRAGGGGSTGVWSMGVSVVADFADVPDGAILLVDDESGTFLQGTDPATLARLGGLVLTDASPTSPLAVLARECSLPAITGVRLPLPALADGAAGGEGGTATSVTVDATHGGLYRGEFAPGRGSSG